VDRPSFIERLTLPENLIWAWRKVRQTYRSSHEWLDELAVADFELMLEQRLQEIGKALVNGSYQCDPLRPIAQPKKTGPSGEQRARQTFHVSVRDQVAWAALINVIGPALDRQMPTWSYGNRLYRSAWVSVEGKDRNYRVGPYRHSSAHFYLPFQRSWPRYRRHIHWTARRMASKSSAGVPLDHDSARMEIAEQHLPNADRLRYLDEGYWSPFKGAIYWGGIDLAKFYPSVELSHVAEVIGRRSGETRSQLDPILDQLCRFPVSYEDWISDEELEVIDLAEREPLFRYLPTGLMVSGFLANVAMLDVDEEVALKLETDRTIAHFRFVDDHVILARRFEDLERWIDEYRDILSVRLPTVLVNPDKSEPSALGDLFRASGDEATPSAELVKLRRAAKAQSEVDAAFPAPLMTMTLAKVSAAAHTDFQLLDGQGQQRMLRDLEQLLLSPLPDTELKEPTRVAFAATMLASFGSNVNFDSYETVKLAKNVSVTRQKLQGLDKSIAEARPNTEHYRSLKQARKEVALAQSAAAGALAAHLKDNKRRETQTYRHVLGLICRAVRRHPEKSKLWDRALALGLATGLNATLPLAEELSRAHRDNPLTARYLRARLIQTIAHTIVNAATKTCDPSLLPRRREAARSFLKSTLQSPLLRRPKRVLQFHELASFELLSCAIGTAQTIISKRGSEEDRKALCASFTGLRAEARKPVSWSRDAATWAQTTPFPVSVWLWWAEGNSVDPDSTIPGPTFSAAAGSLDLEDERAWSLCHRYPRHLPKHFSDSLIIGKHVVDESDYGWLADHLLSLESEPAHSLGAQLKLVLTALDVGPDRCHLQEWALWCARRSASHPLDPRVSEWTALDIVSQIADILSDSGQLARQPAISPYSFTLPRSLMGSPADNTPLTWERWHSALAQQVSLAPVPLVDRRLTPAWNAGTSEEASWAPIQGIALILLGLLQKSFGWPSLWNMYGQERAWMDLARSQISKVPCSSYSTSILAACLTSRAKERTLLAWFGGDIPSSDDTSLDPPDMSQLDLLRRYIVEAKRQLEKLQVSVEENEPRQLVPLALGKLALNPWVEETDGAIELEEDVT